jgi:hypothetical protein
MNIAIQSSKHGTTIKQQSQILDGASRKLRTLVIVNLSYESTNLMFYVPFVTSGKLIFGIADD